VRKSEEEREQILRGRQSEIYKRNFVAGTVIYWLNQ